MRADNGGAAAAENWLCIQGGNGGSAWEKGRGGHGSRGKPKAVGAGEGLPRQEKAPMQPLLGPEEQWSLRAGGKTN